MSQISFVTPTGKTEYIYEGYNCLEENRDVLCLAGTKALIVTGRRSAKQNGSLDEIIRILEMNGIDWAVFDEVEENPSVETVMKAAGFGIQSGVDFVIGIGGGSPMDAAKAIAVMIANPDKGWEYLYQAGAEGTKPLTVIAVPTTCGTGSEVTGVAVLTRNDKQTKESMAHKVFPAYALIDPSFLKAADDRIIRNTFIDSLGHMIESYLSKTRNEECIDAVKRGLSIWKDLKDRVRLGKDSFTDETYSKLMLQSMYAGIAIAFGGTLIPHGLSYRLTYAGHVPHGKAVGYFLAGFLKEAPEEEREALLSMMGFSSCEELDAFFTEVCDADKLPEALIRECVEEVCRMERKLKGAVFAIDREMVERIAGL